MDGAEQPGGARDVLQRQLEEQSLARFASAQLLADGGVICGAVLDGMIEDRRIRSKARHGPLVDIAFERPAVQQVACNVIEPDTLAQIVERLRRFHRETTSLVFSMF